MIEDVVNTTEYCRHCLMCRHVAPVGHITNRETVTPHGVAQLVASERRDMIEWNSETVDALFTFSDGGNSRSHCVTSQPLGEAIAAVRAKLVEEDKAPEVVYEVQQKFERWANPYESVAPEAPSGTGDLALFVGDEATHLHPSTLDAVRTLLQEMGIDPVLVGRGRNNGFLASSLGLMETARDLVEETMKEVEESGAETLLALSPGDYFALGQMCDERLDIRLPDDVELVELTQLLHQKIEGEPLDVSRKQESIPYAYVDPTHSVRVPSHFESARHLAEAAYPEGNRSELFWRKDRAHPSGNLALQFTKPELADDLTRARIKDARDAGAQKVLTADPGSLYHLKKHASSFDVAVEGLFGTLADY